MKKLIGLCLMSALLVSAAWAELSRTPRFNEGQNVVLPESPDRTGSCALVLPQGGAINALGAELGDISSVYLDAATDGDGGCSAPFYPFGATSVDVFFTVWGDSSDVGQTLTITVSLTCPRDAASGTVSTECKGPDGAAFATATASYTVSLADYDTAGANGIFIINVPISACISGPFFANVEYTAWTGIVDQSPVIIFKDTPNVPAVSQACKVWGYFEIPVTVPRANCWWNAVSPLGLTADFTIGTPAHPIGPWYIFVNGDAGADCTPNYSCLPCPRQYGDNDANPYLVNVGSTTLDLCNYCSDYSQETDDQLPPSGGFTARGEDIVLSIPFDPLALEACFAVVLTPDCPGGNNTPGSTLFRLRTWINDSFGTLYDGTPRFPSFGGVQTYNFTASGLGCQAPDNYLLYIDTRNCCCPVIISYSGDTPLPVELTSFNATAGNSQVTLNWVTRAENGIESYQIARNDGQITEVAGLGNSTSGHNYSWVDNNVTNGTRYSYTLTAYNIDGSVVNFTNTAEATPFSSIATEYALAQNFPNPFNPTTSITYSLKDAGNVSLKIFSIDGREVATLVDGHQDANVYSINFDGANLASGVYMYTLEVNGFTASKKMVLMK